MDSPILMDAAERISNAPLATNGYVNIYSAKLYGLFDKNVHRIP